jgi:hypothetical protein
MAKRTKKDKKNINKLYMEDIVASKMDSKDSMFNQESLKPTPDTGSEEATKRNDIKKPVEEVGAPENLYTTHKTTQNEEKSSDKSINNSSIMSENKSTFDKLYEDVMGDENLMLGGEDDLDLGGDELGGDDELGGGGSVHDLLNTAIDALQQLADQLPGNDMGDEMGGDMGDLDSELPEEEGVQAEMHVHADPQALGDSGAHGLMKIGSGGNKVPGAVKKSGGTAVHGNIDDSPVPSVLGGHGDRSHPDAGNTGSGSNKVANTGTPGVNKSLFGN